MQKVKKAKGGRFCDCRHVHVFDPIFFACTCSQGYKFCLLQRREQECQRSVMAEMSVDAGAVGAEVEEFRNECSHYQRGCSFVVLCLY